MDLQDNILEQNANEASNETLNEVAFNGELTAKEELSTPVEEASAANSVEGQDEQNDNQVPQTPEEPLTENKEDAAGVAKENPADQWKLPYNDKSAIVERLKTIIDGNEAINKEEIDHLKTQFYRLHLAEREAQRKQYIEAGGDPEQYQIAPDELEDAFKENMGVIREKRAQLFREQEAEKAVNLKKKLDIIEQLKNMITSPEEVNRSFQDFKNLQQEWRDTGVVPAERSSELWRTYQHYVEQYYDLVKLNNEAREYDFKKNLELKTRLCETAEKLDEEEDVISAFHQLQELHQQFREVGPVAKDMRDEVWNRFKAASTIINKKHQKYFEDIRAKEEENLNAKTALCVKIEAIIAQPVTQSSQWEKLTKEVIATQAEWKTIGFAPQKMNVKIFERFRTACDAFFKAKTQFFKEMKARYAENIAKKKELVEKAEALKDSTDWKATSEQLIALQKEWKTVGVVPKKVGDQLWADFQQACNHFFDARNAATQGQRSEQKENLERKRSIIARLKELLDSDAEDVKNDAQALLDEYYNVGHVPFRDKDKVYAEFKEVADAIYQKHNVLMRRQRLDNFKNSLKEVARKGEDAVDNERTKLMRQYDSLKQEIQTYENNLGFFSFSSKSGSALLDDMQKKIERLKDNMNLVRDKIRAIDQAGKESAEKEQPAAEEKAENESESQEPSAEA